VLDFACEDCADGNGVSGDGCSSTCQFEFFCGDGIAGSGTLSCAGPSAGVDVSSTLDHNIGDVDPTCAFGFLELEDGSSRHPGVCNGPQMVTTSGTGLPGSARLDIQAVNNALEGCGL